MKNAIARLKQKWGITSNLDFIAIMTVFSLSGMMISVCRKPIFLFFGITPDKPLWLKTLVYIPFVFPVYQVSLVIFGFLLGQFGFFWDKEKKLGRFFLRFFRKILSPILR